MIYVLSLLCIITIPISILDAHVVVGHIRLSLSANGIYFHMQSSKLKFNSVVPLYKEKGDILSCPPNSKKALDLEWRI